MKLTKILMLLLLTATITQCSGEAEKSITGGADANPEENPLPPNPNFSDSLTLQQCANLFNSLVSDTKCWVRGDTVDGNYTELVLVPDADATTGFLSYGTKADSTDLDYNINGCDADGVHLSQAGGITLLVSGSELNFQFDSWDKPYRYKASSTCTM